MRGDVPSARRKSLVIGYGNTLRSDDGAGVRVAESIAAWNIPGVITMSVHQLTPEIAETLAAVDIAIIIDAELAEAGGEITISRIRPASSVRAAGHYSDLRSLLALAGMLYGRSPEAWLIGVPAVDLSLGEVLSPTTARGVEAASEQIRRIIVT